MARWNTKSAPAPESPTAATPRGENHAGGCHIWRSRVWAQEAQLADQLNDEGNPKSCESVVRAKFIGESLVDESAAQNAPIGPVGLSYIRLTSF